MSDKVELRRLKTSIPGLDTILEGGLPEFSFNVIAGGPGSGKTTFAQQLMFGMASPSRPALYFTMVGEPPLKMLRYEQQFEFFDLEKLDESVRFINLSHEIANGSFDGVLARILEEVEAALPSVVIVDSFRTMNGAAESAASEETSLQNFIQELGVWLTSWEGTTFIVGQYDQDEAVHNPLFTVADGVIWLDQCVDHNSMVRKVQILKMRGQASQPGLHPFRISRRGIEIFPRVAITHDREKRESAGERRRLSIGIPTLDEMLGGGILAGDSVLVVGPSGAGKSVLAAQFIMAGVRDGEPGSIALFEKHSSTYVETAPGGTALREMIGDGRVGLIHPRLLDLCIDEMLHDIVADVQRRNVRRLVIDSLSGFELALAPTFRHEFRESLARMLAVLASMGITVMMTAELDDRYIDLRFSPHGIAFLTDAIIMQSYVERQGGLQPVLGVVKLRGSAHSRAVHAFTISGDGIEMGAPLHELEGLLAGGPHPAPTRLEHPARRQ